MSLDLRTRHLLRRSSSLLAVAWYAIAFPASAQTTTNFPTEEAEPAAQSSEPTSEQPAPDSATAPSASSEPAATKAPATPVEAPPAPPAEAAPKTRSSSGRGAKKSPAKDAAAAAGETPDSTPEGGSDAPAATPDAAVEAPTAAVVEASLIEALGAAPTPARRTNRRASSTTVATAAEEPGPAPAVDETPEDPQDVATRLLERALRLGHDKDDDAEWLHSSAVKTHMRRMDPSFSEKALGYRSFNDFVKARESIAELEETGHERLVRLRE